MTGHAFGGAERGKDAEPDRVAEHDDPLEIADARRDEKDHQTRENAEDQIGLVSQRGDRRRADDHVAQHAAADADGTGENDHAEQIEFEPDAAQRAGNGENHGSSEVENEDQRFKRYIHNRQ